MNWADRWAIENGSSLSEPRSSPSLLAISFNDAYFSSLLIGEQPCIAMQANTKDRDEHPISFDERVESLFHTNQG